MPKPNQIELTEAEILIPILYEDRSLIAVDKPAGWLLAPDSWDQTGRNLQLALQSSLNAGDFWARSRNLKYLRYVHRLDAETTGLLLFAKSSGALRSYTELFETRSVEKAYLAVVKGVPKQAMWACDLPLEPDPHMKGRMQVANSGPGARRQQDGRRDSKFEPARDAHTDFRVLQALEATAVVEARPATGRTHQIRVHLAAAGFPILGDAMYGPDPAAASKGRQRIALRATRLVFRDPFQKRMVRIEAPITEFAREYGFDQAIYAKR
jgi:23S rRNA pseudouridine1911/1915/1917 synthase